MPVARRRPATQAAAFIRRPPAGCSSSTRSTPWPQATTIPLASAASTAPGAAAPAVPGLRQRLPDLHLLAGERRRRRPAPGSNARTWRSSAAASSPSRSPRRALDLGGVGRALVRLRRDRQRPSCALQPGEDRDDRVGARRGQPVVQRRAGVARVDRHADDREHRAGVEAGVHLHDRDAGLGIAREQRALDRRRTAPARQQRRVDVDAAVPRPGAGSPAAG